MLDDIERLMEEVKGSAVVIGDTDEPARTRRSMDSGTKVATQYTTASAAPASMGQHADQAPVLHTGPVAVYSRWHGTWRRQ